MSGKAENLSQLARAGFPVPAGFVVSTAAYRLFVRANDLQPRIVALAKGDPDADVEEASAEIGRLFEAEASHRPLRVGSDGRIRRSVGNGVQRSRWPFAPPPPLRTCPEQVSLISR